MNKKMSAEHFRILLMLLTLFICMMTFATVQPFGDGPDEINRFKLVEYIYNHGTLPVGDDPEVLIDGYGGSYAFQPMLTYIIDGYLLRALRVFEPSLEMRVFIARLVNVFIGLLTAIYVKKLSDLLFTNKKAAWAFTLAVVFLPQNLFIHTYVNTDSMGLLSIAVVLYALVKGIRNDLDKSSCITLAVGIILCALSYYNCYGIIVCAILFFALYFFKKVRQRCSVDEVSSAKGNLSEQALPLYDYHALLRKGIFISVIVLIGISWWFIRNAILYDGDFLAMEARALCAAETSIESLNPLTRDTYQKLGIPLKEMIFGTDYFTLVWKSFIAMFGPMLIPTHHYIYMAFRDVFFVAVVGLLIPKKTSVLTWTNKYSKWLMHGIMALAIVIPVILALYYSYTYDFQPQGRYYLPMVVPFMYFLVMGVEKIIDVVEWCVGKLSGIISKGQEKTTSKDRIVTLSGAFLYHLLYAFLAACLMYATFISMSGYYSANGLSLF